MKHITNFIKQFDIFGVPLQLQIQSKEKFFQSTWGGLTTIAIYIVSFLYSLQLIYLWFTYQLAPQVNSQSNPSANGHQLQFGTKPFTLSLIATGLSPQKRDQAKGGFMYNSRVTVFGGMIFSSVLYDGIDNFTSCDRSVYQPDYLFTSICPDLSHTIENTLNETKTGGFDTIIFYEAYYCDSTKDSRCYGKDYLADGVGQRLIWELILYREEVDPQTGEVYTIQKPYYLTFSNDTTKFLNIQLKVTKGEVSMDTGYFFSDPKQITIINDIEPFITLETNNDLARGPMVSLSLEKYYYTISIEFPSFTLILSQVISFFQTLVLCGFIANMLNSSQMEEFMRKQLLKIYFPQFLNIREETNIFGKVQRVFYDESLLDGRTILELQEKKGKILELVQRRLNIFYLIQDVCQLQIALQLMQPKLERHTYNLSFLDKDTLTDQQGLNEHDFFKIFDAEQKIIPRSTRVSNLRTYPEKSEIMPPDIVSINLD